MVTYSLVENSFMQDVRTFHEAAETAIETTPCLPGKKIERLRKRLLSEEADETTYAMEDRDLVEIADGLIDTIYVCLGALFAYGLPTQALWDEVQRSNMAKFLTNPDGKPYAQLDEGGKIMKPEGWTPPDIEGVLLRHGWVKPVPEPEPAIEDLKIFRYSHPEMRNWERWIVATDHADAARQYCPGLSSEDHEKQIRECSAALLRSHLYEDDDGDRHLMSYLLTLGRGVYG